VGSAPFSGMQEMETDNYAHVVMTTCLGIFEYLPPKSSFMGKSVIILLSFLSLLSFSCTTNGISGKTFYLLNANLDAITIEEYQMDFISNDKVELKRTFHCNSFECISEKTTKGYLDQTITKTYSYKDGYIKIEGIPDLNRVSLETDSEVKANTGEVLYTASIVDANKDEKQHRITNYFKGNESVAKLFIRILSNGAPRALVEKTKGGDLLLHNEKDVADHVMAKDWDNKAAKLFAMNTAAELIEHFGQGNVTQRKAYGYENQDLGYEYVVFKGTAKEIIFYFAGEQMHSISFKRAGNFWQLPYNLKVGMPITEMENINGTAFKVLGFGTDGGGLVLDWQGGKLANAKVSVRFDVSTNNAIPESLESDEGFYSNTNDVDQLDIRIKEITIFNKR
jgi:hypothetical protein